MTDPSKLTATEAARRIRAGQLAPSDLMASCLEAMAARDGTVRAMAWLDEAACRRAAAAPSAGALHGLPVGVKDVLDTADMPSEYGSPIWRGHRPRADAACVAWTRRAGGVITGKTVTTEFATRHPGPTTNPHDPRRTPGGSSSGSAAGVAAGFFPLAFGTQTAGSVIRPAAFCGVTGYKPTYGTIHRGGMKVMAESLDTIGVIARSVADCALLADAVSGAGLGDPDRHPGAAPRIGLCRSPMWDKAAPETQALLSDAADRLGRQGATLRDTAPWPGFDGLEEAHGVVMNGESARSLGWERATAPDLLSDGLRERMEWGLACSAETRAAADRHCGAARLTVPGLMEGFDVLLTPSAPGEAPEGLGWTGDASFNLLWTTLHLPCVTVPAGAGPNGMPLGLQIVGRHGEDRQTLAWAQWVASALG